jgi:hypothetical protein
MPYLYVIMKKTIALSILFLFLITNSGMAISVHWCGGKITSVDFFSAAKHPCKCGKKAMKPNCCKNKTTTLKANDELLKTSHFSLKSAFSESLIPIVKQIEVMLSAQLNYSISVFYYPPQFKPKVPIYLLDKVFLI